MKTGKVLGYVIFVVLAAAVWLAVVSFVQRLEIVSRQVFRIRDTNGAQSLRGYPINDATSLQSALLAYGINTPLFTNALPKVNFSRTFLYAVENGRLIEFAYDSRLNYAVLETGSNGFVTLYVVRGQMRKPIKAITKN
jgi:hypothetical protein